MKLISRPSLGATVAPLVKQLIADAAHLRLGVDEEPGGAVLVDGGIDVSGGLEAGRRIAEICMGGLGHVRIESSNRFRHWPIQISVHAANPVLACLASQYAGWSLSAGTGEGAFHALGSGPGRALACVEPLYETLGYRDKADSATLVLEVGKRPPETIVDKVAKACGVAPDRITFILTPTQSLAGTVQIVARVLEVALHKIHALGFPLERVIDGVGNAPLPPPSPSFLTAMGRTNDAILYGGEVQLFVRGPEAEARALAEKLPSLASRDYGRPFRETFEGYKNDFFAIDPMLFSPARVIVTALETGRSFRGGEIDEALINRSFGHDIA